MTRSRSTYGSMTSDEASTSSTEGTSETAETAHADKKEYIVKTHGAAFPVAVVSRHETGRVFDGDNVILGAGDRVKLAESEISFYTDKGIELEEVEPIP